MDDCYLSPNGEFFYGLTHVSIADRIIQEFYGIDIGDHNLSEEDFQKYKNSERFLEERGWMKYINRHNIGWFIHPLKNPTQAQIDAVWEKCYTDVSKMGSLY